MKYLTENRKIVEKLRVTIENGSCKTSSLNNNYYILLMEKIQKIYVSLIIFLGRVYMYFQGKQNTTRYTPCMRIIAM